ncbi:hypothetical protein BV25DRAFT_1785350, partial [Artomyces pyxidatus]
YSLAIRWVAGHEDVEGNELSDARAKEAAAGRTSRKRLLPEYLRNGPLPLSVSALRQAHQVTLQARWKTSWQRSPRHARLSHLDPSLPSKSFLKLV